MICIEIEVDDQGQVTVGVCPPEANEGMPGEEGPEKAYMKPAPSVDAALMMAKQLLSQGGQAAPAPQPSSPQSSMPSGLNPAGIRMR